MSDSGDPMQDEARERERWEEFHAPVPLVVDNREAVVEGLKVAMLGTTDGGFIDGNDEIPAGEMFRLAVEYFEGLLSSGVVEERATAEREAAAKALEWLADDEESVGGDMNVCHALRTRAAEYRGGSRG